jgi:lipopolysaccharide export system permease protein
VPPFATLCPPVLTRHVITVCARTTGLCVAAFLAIYLVVEFFEKFEVFLYHGAAPGAIVRYFLFRIPMFLTRVVPMAVLAGILLGLGNLGRHHEFVALRAAGVSVWQISAGLLLVVLALSGLTLLWNEHVVPDCSQRAHDVYATQIRQRPLKGQGRRNVWYRGLAGFYNIRHVGERGLVGLTVYQLDAAFEPRRVVHVDRATWEGPDVGWTLVGGRAYRLHRDGRVEPETVGEFRLPESPADFLAAPGEAEEFSFAGLRQYIRELRRKGADPSEFFVELQLKLAVPFASLIMALVAIPLATRGTRTSSVAGAVTFGLALGFSYWIVLGFAKALGEGGALHPVAAAWAANAIFALVGLYLFLGAD